MAGRVFKDKPAPDNLEVPPHMYLSDNVFSSAKRSRPEPRLPHPAERKKIGAMADLQTAPAGAGTGQKLLTWIDNRFPMSKLYKEQPLGVLRAEELQHLVRLRRPGDAGAGDADPHRHLPDDALQARRRQGVRVGRVHHA